MKPSVSIEKRLLEAFRRSSGTGLEADMLANRLGITGTTVRRKFLAMERRGVLKRDGKRDGNALWFMKHDPGDNFSCPRTTAVSEEVLLAVIEAVTELVRTTAKAIAKRLNKSMTAIYEALNILVERKALVKERVNDAGSSRGPRARGHGRPEFAYRSVG